jgi:hypothetical protein
MQHLNCLKSLSHRLSNPTVFRLETGIKLLLREVFNIFNVGLGRRRRKADIKAAEIAFLILSTSVELAFAHLAIVIFLALCRCLYNFLFMFAQVAKVVDEQVGIVAAVRRSRSKVLHV